MSSTEVQFLTVNTTEALRWWQRLAPDGPIPLHRNTLYRHIASSPEVDKNEEGEWRIPVAWLDARYHRSDDCPLPPAENEPPTSSTLEADEADGLAALLLDQQHQFGAQLERLLDRHDHLTVTLRSVEVDRATLEERRSNLESELDRMTQAAYSKESEVDGLRATLEHLRADLEAERVNRAKAETELAVTRRWSDVEFAKVTALHERLDEVARPSRLRRVFGRSG